MLWMEETLSDISSLLGFEIQLKPEQRKSIIICYVVKTLSRFFLR
jgi:hypothetical protein